MASKGWFQDFVDSEVDLAGRVPSNISSLIFSALIAGLASVAWPRPSSRSKLDRQRFIEAWVRLSPPGLGANRISMPLLIAALERSGDAKAATRLRATHGSLTPDKDVIYAAYVPGPEVDLPSAEVKVLVSGLETSRIRRYSYGSVFYAEVRSSLFHEYQFGRDAGRMAGGPGVGYFSTSAEDGPPAVPGKWSDKGRRQIHFPFSWMEVLTRGIAESVEPLVAQRPRKTLPYPSQWWIDGG
jgi:hypothetical protein